MELILHVILTAIILVPVVVIMYYLRLMRKVLGEINKSLNSMRSIITINNPMPEYSKLDTVATQKLYAYTTQAMKNYKGPSRAISDVVMSNRSEAETVLNAMTETATRFGWVSLDDYYDLVGIPSTFEDTKWGWDDLTGTKIDRYVGDKWVMEFPPLKPLVDTKTKLTPNNPSRNT